MAKKPTHLWGLWNKGGWFWLSADGLPRAFFTKLDAQRYMHRCGYRPRFTSIVKLVPQEK